MSPKTKLAMDEGVFVLGVCGPLASGKTSVLAALRDRYQAHLLVADELGHEVLDREAVHIAGVFQDRCPNPLLLPGPRIDRSALGRFVFAHPEALHELESIVHPAVHTLAQEKISALRGANPQKRQLVVLEAALLFEGKLNELCDAVLWVDAPKCLRVRRALRRARIKTPLIARSELRLSIRHRIQNQSRLGPQSCSAPADILNVMNIFLPVTLRRVSRYLSERGFGEE